jgi:hypothetical protein
VGTLKEKHEELKEAHNSLFAQEVKGKMSMGVECNILNTSPCTFNPSCSTSTSSCISEDMSCDSFLLENESLKKEIECLSKDLARYFGSHVRVYHIWIKQKFTLDKDALGYLPKKGKEAFIPKESIFVSSNVPFEEEEKVKMCHKCKPKVYVNHQCKSKKTVSLDPSYILKKILRVLFVLNMLVALLVVVKRNLFGCQKFLSLTLKDLRKFGYLKQSNFFCR